MDIWRQQLGTFDIFLANDSVTLRDGLCVRSPRLFDNGPNCKRSKGEKEQSRQQENNGSAVTVPYTPPPILSPKRQGTGLFWNISRQYWNSVVSSPPSFYYYRRQFWSRSLDYGICDYYFRTVPPSPSTSPFCRAAATNLPRAPQ